MKSIIIFCLSFYLVFAKHEEYDGHALYQINARNLDEIKLINELENTMLVDVWTYAIPGTPGQILVPKEEQEAFENVLNSYGLEYKIEVQNIRELIELEEEQLKIAASRSTSNSSTLGFDKIHTYDEINAFMQELANKYNHVTLVNAGNSIQGRPINYLRISTTNFQNTRKPVVVLQSLLHSREWITQPATLYAMHKLVINVTESDLVNNIDWIIIPVANPDGYIWTHTNARFWRKNRRTGNRCIGVDLNRNFDSNWGTASSNNPCQETFHGARAMSEPETQAIGNIIARYSRRIALYVDIHSFGSLILYGYGTGVLPPNGLVLNLVAVRMAEAIDRVKLPRNPKYRVGNIAHVLYQASGGSSDFVQRAGVPLSYTYELPAHRNLNTVNGFLVDPAFIEQAGYETWEGIKAGARYVMNNAKSTE